MPRFFIILILLPIFGYCRPEIHFPSVDDQPGPNCHMCEVIINNVRYQYHNDFTNVTVEQLKQSLYQQCNANFNGFTDEECHKKADADAADVLQQLKEGKSSYRICQQENLC